MAEKVVPMIHVPNVRATVEWYESIGFKIINIYSDDAQGLSFAMMSFGETEVMFNQGGSPSSSRRREVDLYVYADDVDALFNRLKDRVEIVEGLHDTFYGMREFIIRDLNRFWMTFGQPSAYSLLMNGVHQGDQEMVRAALGRSELKPEALSAALALATSGESRSAQIAAMLTKAGATPPPQVDEKTLQSYVGSYKGERGLAAELTLKDGQLSATPAGQETLRLVALDTTTFKPIAFDGVRLSFEIEAGETIGVTLHQDGQQLQMKRVSEE